MELTVAKVLIAFPRVPDLLHEGRVGGGVLHCRQAYIVEDAVAREPARGMSVHCASKHGSGHRRSRLGIAVAMAGPGPGTRPAGEIRKSAQKTPV